MIKKIFHVADLHQQLYKKHDMSLFAYNALVESIKIQDKKYDLSFDEGVIVIAGDLFHQFSNVSNESNLHVINLLQNLLSLHRVVMIAGNHDWNENNVSRLDSITPIYKAINSDKLFYFKDSTCYEIDNVLFCNYSVFEELKKPNIPNTNLTKVGLYHAPISSCRTIFGEVKSAVVTTNIFEDCDFVISGDIHQYQELKYNSISIVYSGSLFQQNMGESVYEHGYVLWDVNQKTHKFIEIEPLFSYYNIKLENPIDIDLDKEEFTNLYFTKNVNKEKNINVNCEIKIKINCFRSEETAFKKDIKEKLILKYNFPKKTKFKWDRTYSKELVSATNLNLNDVTNGISLIPKINTWVSRSTNNIDVQNRFSDLLEAKIQQLKEKGEWNLPEESRFEILSFGAKNILSFENIELNIADYKGITVIYADNGVGKTHISRLITFLLYGSFYKKEEKQTIKDAFNWYTDQMEASGWIKIFMENKYYLISRILVKSKKGDITHTVKIHEVDSNGDFIKDLTIKKIEKDKNNKSDLDEFQSKLGDVKDFIFTSFFDSFNLEKWVDDGQASVNERIFRYQGLESLIKIQKLAKEDHKTFLLSSKYINLSRDVINNDILDLEVGLNDNAMLISDNLKKIQLLDANVKRYDAEILSLHKKIKAISVDLLDFDINKHELKISELESDNQSINNRLFKNKEKLIYYNSLKLIKEDIENQNNGYSEQLKNVTVNENLIQQLDSLQYMKLSFKLNAELESEKEALVKQRDNLLLEYRKCQELILTTNSELEKLPNKFECDRCGQIFEENDFLRNNLISKIDSYKRQQLAVKNNGVDIKQLLNIVEEKIQQESLQFHTDIDVKIKEQKNIIDNDRKHKIDSINLEINKWSEKYTQYKAKNFLLDEIDKDESKLLKNMTDIKYLHEKIIIYNKSADFIEYNKEVESDINDLRVKQKEDQNEAVRLDLENNRLITENRTNSIILEEKNETLLKIKEDEFTDQVYKFFINAFGREGFPKHIIQTLLPKIESEVQEILEEIDFGFNFSIKSDDKNIEFFLEREGIKNEVKQYSGFEKWIPCLALHKAIMPSCMIPFTNIITFDEIFSAPSEKNLPNCYKIIEKMQEVYDNVFIISHNSDIRAFADQVISLEKENNITKIV